jgi:septal ring factor EnvC (AmiA/AmiB activator)
MALAGPILAIDHGASVVTVYRGDVANVEVVPGQTVKAGQEIGRVGPGHQLHWELSIHGVDVDPVEWTRRQFP